MAEGLGVIILIIIVLGLGIIVGNLAIKFDKKELDKKGPNNRCVRSVIAAYQIVSNSSRDYEELREIFDNSKRFVQLRSGREEFMAKGFVDNLLVIKCELLNCNLIDEEIKNGLQKVSDESLRIVKQANIVSELI